MPDDKKMDSTEFIFLFVHVLLRFERGLLKSLICHVKPQPRALQNTSFNLVLGQEQGSLYGLILVLFYALFVQWYFCAKRTINYSLAQRNGAPSPLELF